MTGRALLGAAHYCLRHVPLYIIAGDKYTLDEQGGKWAGRAHSPLYKCHNALAIQTRNCAASPSFRRDRHEDEPQIINAAGHDAAGLVRGRWHRPGPGPCSCGPQNKINGPDVHSQELSLAGGHAPPRRRRRGLDPFTHPHPGLPSTLPGRPPCDSVYTWQAGTSDSAGPLGGSEASIFPEAWAGGRAGTGGVGHGHGHGAARCVRQLLFFFFFVLLSCPRQPPTGGL